MIRVRCEHKWVLHITRSVRWYCLPPTISQFYTKPPLLNSIVEAHGHISSVRNSKNAAFVDLTDGTSHRELNVVCKNTSRVLSNSGLKRGQSVAIRGEWVESPGFQPYELVFDSNNPMHSFKIIGDISDPYPIQKKANLLQHLRSFPLLRHRTSLLSSLLRFRSKLEHELFSFFDNEAFTKVTPALITGTDCEGAGEQFKLSTGLETSAEKFFDKDTYLTVSAQLHLEVLSQSMGRVWCLSPCFRAEPSDTSRHLSEFWMLEAEISHITQLSQLTLFTEKMIRHVAQGIRESNIMNYDDLLRNSESELLQQRWGMLLQQDAWPVINYSEAIELVNRDMFKGKSQGRLAWGEALQSTHEKWLAGTYFKSPVFITNYPLHQKPFYMQISPGCDTSKQTVSCFDLLLPDIGELVGGSMREHRYEQLFNEMKKRGMNQNGMEWYLSTRQNGTIPHGGFGMGIERLVMYLTAIDNVRDIVPFPRVHGSCPC